MIGLLFAANCPAATHYVSLSGTNNYPYTNWPDAATDITWAVSAAVGGEMVLVTNGVYYPTQRIYLATGMGITLQSVSGRDVTIINGQNNTNICADLGSASVFDGFTVTNCNNTKIYGLVSIGTVRNCLFVNNTVRGGTVGSFPVSITNCIFKNNNATTLSGAIYAGSGAGTFVTIAGCQFEGNNANGNYGGACDIRDGNSIVSNCVFIKNSAKIYGGALFLDLHNTNSLIVNCVFTSNVVAGGVEALGGGIYSEMGITIRNCSFIGNIATNAGGGIFIGRYTTTNAIIRNCLIARNGSVTNIGGGIWMTTGVVENCTIVSNYAAVAGGGVYINGSGSSGTNNIIYFNTAPNAANFTNTAGNTGLSYCCVFPAVGGIGNITNDPRMLDLAGGNYHPRMNSPCVNAGTNQNWMTNAIDLDGIQRIRYGIVDMGAYEAVLRQGNIYRVH